MGVVEQPPVRETAVLDSVHALLPGHTKLTILISYSNCVCICVQDKADLP